MESEIFKDKEKSDTLQSTRPSMKTDDGELFDATWAGATVVGAVGMMVLSMLLSSGVLAGGSGMLILGVIMGMVADKNVMPEVGAGTFILFFIGSVLSTASSLTGIVTLLLGIGFVTSSFSAGLVAVVGMVGALIGGWLSRKL